MTVRHAKKKCLKCGKNPHFVCSWLSLVVGEEKGGAVVWVYDTNSPFYT